jgi:hypothetical protein
VLVLDVMLLGVYLFVFLEILWTLERFPTYLLSSRCEKGYICDGESTDLANVRFEWGVH